MDQSKARRHPLDVSQDRRELNYLGARAEQAQDFLAGHVHRQASRISEYRMRLATFFEPSDLVT